MTRQANIAKHSHCSSSCSHGLFIRSGNQSWADIVDARHSETASDDLDPSSEEWEEILATAVEM
eukprot:3975975-Karenia_brevis.AAC.1